MSLPSFFVSFFVYVSVYFCVAYKLQYMVELKQTATFRKWLNKLRDKKAVGLVASRLSRLAYGHTGDVKSVGGGVSELRIHYSPGYRIYFQRRDNAIIVLPCGGNKDSQAHDIKTARKLASNCEEP